MWTPIDKHGGPRLVYLDHCWDDGSKEQQGWFSFSFFPPLNTEDSGLLIRHWCFSIHCLIDLAHISNICVDFLKSFIRVHHELLCRFFAVFQQVSLLPSSSTKRVGYRQVAGHSPPGAKSAPLSPPLCKARMGGEQLLCMAGRIERPP